VSGKYIVTDLPYGKNTKDIDFDLYKRFMKNLKAKKAVIVFPSDYKIKADYKYYVHRSLSKKIVIS
jgi:tRNA G10  N-methylase Trm11